MILFRCLAGVFAGTVLTVRAMLTENSTKATQARAFSYFAFAGNLGIFVGPLIGTSSYNCLRSSLSNLICRWCFGTAGCEVSVGIWTRSVFQRLSICAPRIRLLLRWTQCCCNCNVQCQRGSCSTAFRHGHPINNGPRHCTFIKVKRHQKGPP